MGADAWLFTKGTQSVRILRTSDPPTLLILGPASERESYQLTSEEELNVLHARVEAWLSREGWVYVGRQVDRRVQSADRAMDRVGDRRRNEAG